jgi:hypothetical protein
VAQRRHRLVDTEIRGVSHHCRIVTYQDALLAVPKVTTSSLLSVTGQYGTHRAFLASCGHPEGLRRTPVSGDASGCNPAHAIRLVPISVQRGTGTG